MPCPATEAHDLPAPRPRFADLQVGAVAPEAPFPGGRVGTAVRLQANGRPGLRKPVSVIPLPPSFIHGARARTLQALAQQQRVAHRGVLPVLGLDENERYLVVPRQHGRLLSWMWQQTRAAREQFFTDAAVALGALVSEALWQAYQARTPAGEPQRLVHGAFDASAVLISHRGRVQIWGFGGGPASGARGLDAHHRDLQALGALITKLLGHGGATAADIERRLPRIGAALRGLLEPTSLGANGDGQAAAQQLRQVLGQDPEGCLREFCAFYFSEIDPLPDTPPEVELCPSGPSPQTRTIAARLRESIERERRARLRAQEDSDAFIIDGVDPNATSFLPLPVTPRAPGPAVTPPDLPPTRPLPAAARPAPVSPAFSAPGPHTRPGPYPRPPAHHDARGSASAIRRVTPPPGGGPSGDGPAIRVYAVLLGIFLMVCMAAVGAAWFAEPTASSLDPITGELIPAETPVRPTTDLGDTGFVDLEPEPEPRPRPPIRNGTTPPPHQSGDHPRPTQTRSSDVVVHLDDDRVRKVELICGGGYRHREAIGSGTAVFRGVTGQDCSVRFLGGAPARFSGVQPGETLRCHLQGTTAVCTR